VIRWTLPRIRIDQVMYLCYKVLLPIGMACLLVTAALRLIG
jgi:NADH-quinone oxidoreductase subunit H